MNLETASRQVQTRNDLGHILVVEDENSIAELIEYNLLKNGYRVSRADCGETGLEIAELEKPDLILLDIMLPGISGLEVCEKLKANRAVDGPSIIMISAKGEESDIVKGLELGADDYVTKPFSPKILMARVAAVLRRSTEESETEDSILEIHGIEIDPKRVKTTVAGEIVQLTATEFRLLYFLARHPGWVFTRYQIVDAVRGEDYAVTERAVDVQVVGLRKKTGQTWQLYRNCTWSRLSL